METLREFSEIHIEQGEPVHPKEYENALFFDSVFDDLRGLTLKDCDLNRSRFVTADVEKALGFTLTLNCHSFGGVEYSPLLFDLLLYLLTITKGNDAKRHELKKLLGPRWAALNRLLPSID
ncbi:hypothetical protein CCP3SC15_1830002 [Gammaproteobacteria bacterium]